MSRSLPVEATSNGRKWDTKAGKRDTVGQRAETAAASTARPAR